jgi:transcriptional regulator with XRE-family HTH domain
MQVFSTRLKEARISAKLSQEKLGVLAGIEEASASARMNQYERGKHQPEFSIVERLAKVLNVPEAYFYAKDDDMADLLMLLHRADKGDRATILKMARETL